MLHNFFNNQATGLKFFDILFVLLKILPCTLTIKIRGLIYLNDKALKSWTKDMYDFPQGQL